MIGMKNYLPAESEMQSVTDKDLRTSGQLLLHFTKPLAQAREGVLVGDVEHEEHSVRPFRMRVHDRGKTALPWSTPQEEAYDDVAVDKNREGFVIAVQEAVGGAVVLIGLFATRQDLLLARIRIANDDELQQKVVAPAAAQWRSCRQAHACSKL